MSDYASGAGVSRFLIRFAFLLLLTCGQSFAKAHSVEELEVKYNRDTAYLPYSIVEITSANHGTASRYLFRPIAVIRPSTPDDPEGFFIRAYNPSLNLDNPAIFGYCRFPSMHLDDDNPVYLTVNDYRLYFDDRKGYEAIAGVGYKNDSAWAFRLVPETEEFERVFLTTGRDSTGDGRWDPTINVLLVEDYDYNGMDDAFIYINSGREYVPRVLFCVEMESLKVKWSLPLASYPMQRTFLSCRDSLHPSVIFISYNPKQGVSDANFKDIYGYLTVVDSSGNILFNRIIASQHGGMWLSRAEEKDRYYVTHEIEFADPKEYDGRPSRKYHVSLISSDGGVIHTAEITNKTAEVFLAPYRGFSYDLPFVTSGDLGQFIQVYDTNLVLLAESDAVRIGGFLGRLKINDLEPEALVFSDAVYSATLEKIAAFPFPIADYEPMALDSSGAVTDIALNATNHYLIGTIERKSLVDLMSIFYVRNKAYVLAALVGLFVLLIAVNYYRGRAKHNLIIIARQKDELEQTHEALRQAQQQIIEQEKYKQVKEIAGGFAHEIRNALFPAEGALKKMQAADTTPSEETGHVLKYASLIRAAVSRAIDLTELISEYVRLDTDYLAETVSLKEVIDEVISADGLRIQETGVRIEVRGSTDTTVLANHHQLVVALNNLVVNSLDSLTNVEEPRILIIVEAGAQFVRVSVEDNGCGIPDEIAPRVFDAFFSTKPHRGKGLGLSTAKRIVEMYGGSIKLSTRQGRGSRFDLRLKPAVRTSAPRGE